MTKEEAEEAQQPAGFEPTNPPNIIGEKGRLLYSDEIRTHYLPTRGGSILGQSLKDFSRELHIMIVRL